MKKRENVSLWVFAHFQESFFGSIMYYSFYIVCFYFSVKWTHGKRKKLKGKKKEFEEMVKYFG